MGNPSRRVTLNDVARRSGVSYQTVSRVINNHPYVAEATRQRVLEVIQELGYYPNKAAKSLATQRSHTIAILSYGMAYYGPSQMLINIESAAKEAGYDLIFSMISEPTPENFRDAFDSLAGWQVDGVVAITPVTGCSSDELQSLLGDTPLVQIDTCLGQDAPSVVIDQGYGSALITRHLIELGHRQIAAISGPLHWFGAQARHAAWQQTLHEAGIEPGPSLEGDWTSTAGYHATLALLEHNVPFTALVAGNDQMALGAIRALRQHGRRVPQDVSITGFDNIPESAFFDPPLTTVWQDFSMVGQRSVEMLVERINEPHGSPEQRVLYPRLLVRESTIPLGG
ncbi:MAG: LacI family DNA-binding transcriptional regulator [Anaerolineae bacterium]|nr:LacI family DNA-binding transcriptional regulator [Anaerolineae bacterium]